MWRDKWIWEGVGSGGGLRNWSGCGRGWWEGEGGAVHEA